MREAIKACKNGERPPQAIAINPRPGSVNDVARSVLVALQKKPGRPLGYRANDCEGDTLDWMAARRWNDLVVLSADALNPLQLEWIVHKLGPCVKRLWLLGLRGPEIRRRLPPGWEGNELARSTSVGRFLACLRRRPLPSVATVEIAPTLRRAPVPLFRAACERTLSDAEFAIADDIVAAAAETTARRVKSHGYHRIPEACVWSALATSDNDFECLCNLRGCQIGLLHQGIVLFEGHGDPLRTPVLNRPYEPLYRITDPASTAMAALFLTSLDFPYLIPRLTVTDDSPITLGRFGERISIPARVQPLLRPQLARLRREGRGEPGSLMFPDWKARDPSRTAQRGTAVRRRVVRATGVPMSQKHWFEQAGLAIVDIQSADASEIDGRSRLSRDLADTRLLYEIASTGDPLVQSLDGLSQRVARRLVRAGVLEVRSGHLALTKDAAWGLYLDGELALPCSPYRRPRVPWPVDQSRSAES